MSPSETKEKETGIAWTQKVVGKPLTAKHINYRTSLAWELVFLFATCFSKRRETEFLQNRDTLCCWLRRYNHHHSFFFLSDDVSSDVPSFFFTASLLCTVCTPAFRWWCHTCNFFHEQAFHFPFLHSIRILLLSLSLLYTCSDPRSVWITISNAVMIERERGRGSGEHTYFTCTRVHIERQYSNWVRETASRWSTHSHD